MQFYQKTFQIDRCRHLSIQVSYGIFFCKIEYFQNVYLLRLKWISENIHPIYVIFANAKINVCEYVYIMYVYIYSISENKNYSNY